MKVSVLLLFVLSVLLGFQSAWSFDLQAELSQTGVKVLVLYFYADWCAPCHKSLPKWQALHDKYKDYGLRFVMVNAEYKGQCKDPKWQPDKIVCDKGNVLQQKLQIKNLPQSYVFSWTGDLLAGSTDYAAAAKAVEQYYQTSLYRIKVAEVEVLGDKCAIKSNPVWVHNQVMATLSESAKFDLVSPFPMMTQAKKDESCSLILLSTSYLKI